MSVVIQRGEQFLGVPLLTVRNVLKAWRYGGSSDAYDISARKDVQLDTRTVMVLLEELRDRGLIGPEDQAYGDAIDGLTENGLALVGATGRKRTAKVAARAVLESFLEACTAVNARDDLPFDVQEVWLFGSMLDEEKSDVGDVDLVLITGCPDGFEENAIEAFRKLTRKLGGQNILNAGGVTAILKAPGFVMNHYLHQGRRHPLLSFGDLRELQDLACPCRCLFDAQRGGRVEDPVLSRHPQSNGRSNRIGDKRQLPNLVEVRQALKPVSADLCRPAHYGWKAARSAGPWSIGDPRYELMQESRQRTYVLTHDTNLPTYVGRNVVSKRLDLSDCDGRNRAGLIVAERPAATWEEFRNHVEYPALGCVFERHIDEVAGHLRLSFVSTATRGRSVGRGEFLAAIWWLSILISADIERLCRRDGEERLKRRIGVAVSDLSDSSIGDELTRTMRPLLSTISDQAATRAESVGIEVRVREIVSEKSSGKSIR